MGFDTINQRNTLKPRGMALVSVLLVTVVLLAMAGAFFAAHRADLALLSSTTYREQTKNACLSVAEFIQFKLQNDRTFGTEPFSKRGPGSMKEVFPARAEEPLLTVHYQGQSLKTNKLIGHMPTSKVDFEVVLVNNLNSSRGKSLVYDKDSPPRTARAWITSRRGNITSKIDVIFKMSPFTNASISSGKNITVDLANSENGYWLLGAMQPSGNAVRAENTIKGPEVWSRSGKAVQFLPPPGMEDKLDAPYGVLQAKTLNMQVDGVHRPLKAGSQVVEESEANIQGVLSPGGGAVKIPELDRGDLQSSARKVRFPYSELVFKTAESTSGPVHRLEDGRGGLIAKFSSEDYSSRNFPLYDDQGQLIASFDLENRVMMVTPDTEIQVRDDFRLSARTANGDLDTARQPTVILGNSENGASIDAPSISIEGSVGGYGALKSSQGNIEIAAKSALSTTPDYGIALHSEKNVVLTKPGQSNNDGLAVDWDAFAMGMRPSKGNNANLNQWGYLNDATRQTEASRFQSRTLAKPGQQSTFQSLWDGLTADFPADQRALDARDAWLKTAVPEEFGPDPNWEGPSEEQPTQPQVVVKEGEPEGSGINVEKYVRLREYLRTVKSGAPDSSWLEGATPEIQEQRSLDVTKLIKNQLSSYQLSAGQVTTKVNGQPILTWKALSSYFRGNNPHTASYAPDMLFRGLVYTKGDFIFDTERKGVYIEGALVTKGSVRIENATGAHFVYNSDLLQNLFATDNLDLSVPLERAYWAYY